MYKMNTRMLLAIAATTAALTIMTSSIGVGIFSQHANANKPNCSQTNTCNGNGATVLKLPSPPLKCTVNGHPGRGTVVSTPSGNLNGNCHVS